MFQKGQCYLADWRDKDGKRKRKSFPDAASALAYEAAQKAVPLPKSLRAARRSGTRSAHSSQGRPGGTQRSSQPGSLRSMAALPSRRSASTISHPSTRISRNTATPLLVQSEHRPLARSSARSKKEDAKLASGRKFSSAATPGRATSQQQTKSGSLSSRPLPLHSAAGSSSAPMRLSAPGLPQSSARRITTVRRAPSPSEPNTKTRK